MAEKLFPEQLPTSLGSPKLPSSLGFTRIKAVADLSNKRVTKITWPAQSGAVKYIVYASPSPEFLKKFVEIPRTKTEAEFAAPIVVPDDLTFYFNVSYVTPGGTEQFIQDVPTFNLIDGAFDDASNPISDAIRRDIIDGFDIKFFIEEIRRRGLAMLQMNGEDFWLHIRRLYGQPCVCRTRSASGVLGGRMTPMATDDYNQIGQDFDPKATGEFEANEAKDPEFQSDSRCNFCFGTGIAGGYLPKIKIRVRYGNVPKRIIHYREYGMEFVHNFDSWTLWHPKLKENDMVIRIRDGERFFIKNVGNTAPRGIALHQEFNATAENRNSPIYNVTDERILDAVKEESVFDIGKFDWAIWS